MIRTLLVLPLVLATGAIAAEQRLPVPPIPPASPPSVEAPVPDVDAQGPASGWVQAPVTLDMGINRRGPPGTGLGYTPGSRYQVDNDRKPLAVPGIRWHMPFQ